MSKVFFIGKVSEYDWRSDIIDWQKDKKVDGYEFMGPFYQFIHEGDDAKRSFIFQQNIDLISKSDVLFAYIDSPDAYGALFELGFAYAIKKPFYVFFKRGIDYRDMWFSSIKAQQIFIVDDHREAWEIFRKRHRFHEFGKLKKISYE